MCSCKNKSCCPRTPEVCKLLNYSVITEWLESLSSLDMQRNSIVSRLSTSTLGSSLDSELASDINTYITEARELDVSFKLYLEPFTDTGLKYTSSYKCMTKFLTIKEIQSYYTYSNIINQTADNILNFVNNPDSILNQQILTNFTCAFCSSSSLNFFLKSQFSSASGSICLKTLY
jgi:hypothetical protein